ncbi:MAG: metallophosphoesterase [Bacteroidia bacterium]|nr:metallophosphoesterase [Bacteroidia bacterium]
MGNIKLYISLTISLALCSCEFDPLDFIRTTYDVDKRTADSIEKNEQNPVSNVITTSDDYSFIIVSDLHLHTDEVMMPKFFSMASNSDASFVVINGDIYNSKSEFAAFAKEQFDNFNAKPCYFVAGNHDMYFDWKLYLDNFGSSTYSFKVQTPNTQDLYIILESGSATLGKIQLEWLKEQLKTRNQYRYCFIVTHTNFIAQEVNNGIYQQEELNVLFKLFADNNVNAVITGHSHETNDKTILNIKYWTTDALKNNNYGIVYVESENINIDFLKLD